VSRTWIYPLLLILIVAFLSLANYWYQNIHLTRGIITIVVLVLIYVFFRIVLEDKYVNKISDSQRRYYISKNLYFLYIFVNLLALLIIWVEDLQALVLGFGLVAAAFTLTMQDVAKNFAGGLSIFFNRIYRVGDRIEIGSKKGDVIDIDIFPMRNLPKPRMVGLTPIPFSFPHLITSFGNDFNHGLQAHLIGSCRRPIKPRWS
jgi:small-conductance mechanosensitive channel